LKIKEDEKEVNRMKEFKPEAEKVEEKKVNDKKELKLEIERDPGHSAR